MLSKKQMEIARLIAEGDFTQIEIAQQFNISHVTISRWKQEKEFNNQVDYFINEMINEQRKELKKLVPKAIRKMESLLNAKKEFIQFNAAKDILDRAGLKPVERIESKNENINKDEIIIVEFGGIREDT